MPTSRFLTFATGLGLFFSVLACTGRKVERGATPLVIPERIAVAIGQEGHRNIFSMNPDGSDLRQLTNTVGDNSDPSWSPDQTRIVFTSNRGYGHDTELMVMNADGSSQKALTQNLALDQAPAWSPDGSLIAYQSNLPPRSLRTGKYGTPKHPAISDTDIWVISADGANPRDVSNHPQGDYYPSWSPDGQRIVFESLRNLNWEIYVMNADGSGQVRLTNNVRADQAPAWSPTGDEIAFQAAVGGEWDLFVVRSDGSMMRQLTRTSADEGYPSWSPDGEQLVYMNFAHGQLGVCVSPLSFASSAHCTGERHHPEYFPSW